MLQAGYEAATISQHSPHLQARNRFAYRRNISGNNGRGCIPSDLLPPPFSRGRAECAPLQCASLERARRRVVASLAFAFKMGKKKSSLYLTALSFGWQRWCICVLLSEGRGGLLSWSTAQNSNEERAVKEHAGNYTNLKGGQGVTWLPLQGASRLFQKRINNAWVEDSLLCHRGGARAVIEVATFGRYEIMGAAWLRPNGRAEPHKPTRMKITDHYPSGTDMERIDSNLILPDVLDHDGCNHAKWPCALKC